MDDTWVNEGHTKLLSSKIRKKRDTRKSNRESHREGLSMGLKNPSRQVKKLIISHIDFTGGFVEGGELIFDGKRSEGDYHLEMDAYNFLK